MMEFFAMLGASLRRGPVALATVVAARGSTPRRVGARQFFDAGGPGGGSVGGGLVEARTAELAAQTLADGLPRVFEANLTGHPHDVRDGICGGRMTIWVVRLGDADLAVVEHVAARQVAGRRVTVWVRLTERGAISIQSPADAAFEDELLPEPLVLVVGAGHVGCAVARAARDAGFEVLVTDERVGGLADGVLARFRRECSISSAANLVAQWEGLRFAALVSRGYVQDVEALANLPEAMHYIGLIGSRRRVAAVLAAHRAAGHPDIPAEILHAPIGIEIGAETPEEIAISITAEIIRVRRTQAPRDLSVAV